MKHFLERIWTSVRWLVYFPLAHFFLFTLIHPLLRSKADLDSPNLVCLQHHETFSHHLPSERNGFHRESYYTSSKIIEKWGWVFYRTTYKDDEAWDIFKQKVNISVRSIVNLDPQSELNEAIFDKLEFVFIEDKAKFDGASKEELRAHFQEWVGNSFSAENPRADQRLLYDEEPVSRYRFFFKIDEDALRSCGSAGSGHANFRPCQLRGWLLVVG
ncbi:hypothetical protein N7530_005448 [Penicillium desertorum]|uniref:Uncharacterized protein n=1 Tax=Penicillium desertorum TaxID=1303715 RepID=A0A9W9X057_9EURO|nr:hypothetical protein N7530_005448 [Penicillium desertorum]